MSQSMPTYYINVLQGSISESFAKKINIDKVIQQLLKVFLGWILVKKRINLVGGHAYQHF